MKTINLWDIIDKYPQSDINHPNHNNGEGDTVMGIEDVYNCMQEFGRQLLELAAENAKINCKLNYGDGKWVQEKFSLYKDDYNDVTSCIVEVNFDSILDTIKQVI